MKRSIQLSLLVCFALLAVGVGTSGAGMLDRIVAVVGSIPILHSDVVDGLTALGYGQTEAAEIPDTSAAYVMVLDQLSEERLIVEGAERLGFFPSHSDLQEMIENELDLMREDYSSEEDFLASLAAAGLTLEEIRGELGDRIASQYGAERLLASRSQRVMGTLPTDPVHFLSVRADLVEEIVMPRRLSWIRIPILPTGPAHLEAESFLMELRSRIVAGEMSFEEAAILHSEDPSGRDGGDLGYFGPDDMTPTFGGAAFSLEEGEISYPVTTPYGVHLIKLTGVEEVEESDAYAGDVGRVRASHILRRLDLTTADMDSAKARAEMVVETIRGGMSFETAVHTFSADWTSIPDDGDLGLILVRWWAPSLELHLMGTDPGEITDPFLSDDGAAYIIARVQGEGSATPSREEWMEFGEAFLDQLTESVISQESFETLVDSLRSEIPVVYPPVIDEA